MENFATTFVESVPVITELGVILGIFAAMLGAFYGIAKFMLKQASDDRQKDREERQLLTLAIQKMADSNDNIAKETAKGNREAKERNGHLAEITIQSRDQVLDFIQHIGKQHVKEQMVDKQTIKEKK